MLHNGPNEVDGIPVEVIRKRIRRYNLRVDSDGTVKLSVPKWWGTLRQAEFFLREKWGWVRKVRGEVLAITNFLKIWCNLCRSRSYSGCKTPLKKGPNP